MRFLANADDCPQPSSGEGVLGMYWFLAEEPRFLASIITKGFLVSKATSCVRIKKSPGETNPNDHNSNILYDKDTCKIDLIRTHETR